MSEGHGLDNSPELRLRNEISQKQFDFGQYFVYTLERGYGDDPDSIVKYEVILEDDWDKLQCVPTDIRYKKLDTFW